jgi:enoyl-CoA hydratase
MYQEIIFSTEDRVAFIKMNREKVLNAMNKEMVDEIRDVITNISSSTDVKVLVITGSNKVFSAGADISGASGINSPEKAYKFSKIYQDLFREIEKLPIPVIAAISGYALGAGAELALSCDLRVASETAKFGLPEIDLGGFPAGGGTQKLPRLVGASKAKEILFTGKPLSAEEVYKLGIFDHIYPLDEYFVKAKDLASFISNKSGAALSTIKSLVNEGLRMDIEAALEFESKSFAALSTSHDFEEGRRAFLEKRKPVFKN